MNPVLFNSVTVLIVQYMKLNLGHSRYFELIGRQTGRSKFKHCIYVLYFTT